MAAPDTPPRSGVYRFTVGLGFALAAAVLIVSFAGSRNGVPDPFSPLSIGLMCAQPAVIAARGFGRRRGALAAAAGMSFPLLVLSFSLIGVVFLVPAIMYIALYQEWKTAEPRILAGIIGIVGFITTVVMFGILIGHDDPACRAVGSGTTCSSDTVTAVEFLLVLAVAAAGHALCWTLSAPRASSRV